MKKFRVLVIDDSKVVCNLIQSMIETRLKAECIFETDPTKLSQDLLLDVDLVILDYYFGSIAESSKKNGLMYLKELNRLNSSIAVIAFSGQKKIAKAAEMVSRGAFEYIDKNEDNFIEVLLQSVKKIKDFKTSGFNIQSSQINVNRI
jgi:DNA-binding NtrC family response regulator